MSHTHSHTPVLFDLEDSQLPPAPLIHYPFPHHSNGLVYSTLDGTNGVKLRADKRANLPLKHLSGYNIKWFGQH